MEILGDPEELTLCPYNKSHHILRKRLVFHLVKCKKNYPNSRMVSCDFNATHIIPEPEIQYHHERCPNRKDIEIMIYKESGEDLNKYPIHNIPVETDECWDDYNTPAYDPKKYCEKNDIIRKLEVESSRKKKIFHIIERNRLNKYKDIKPEEKDTPIKKPTKFRKPVFPKKLQN